MASDLEDDDLEALRKAALATLKPKTQPIQQVITTLSGVNRSSWNEFPASADVVPEHHYIPEPLPEPDLTMNVAIHNLTPWPVNNGISLAGEKPFRPVFPTDRRPFHSRAHHRSFGDRGRPIHDRGRYPRRGYISERSRALFPTGRGHGTGAKTETESLGGNLIVINPKVDQTEESIPIGMGLQVSNNASHQPNKTRLVLPQDKYHLPALLVEKDNSCSTSSPSTKPRDKFSRYDDSGSEDEDDDWLDTPQDGDIRIIQQDIESSVADGNYEVEVRKLDFSDQEEESVEDKNVTGLNSMLSDDESIDLDALASDEHMLGDDFSEEKTVVLLDEDKVGSCEDLNELLESSDEKLGSEKHIVNCVKETSTANHIVKNSSASFSSSASSSSSSNSDSEDDDKGEDAQNFVNKLSEACVKPILNISVESSGKSPTKESDKDSLDDLLIDDFKQDIVDQLPTPHRPLSPHKLKKNTSPLQTYSPSRASPPPRHSVYSGQPRSPLSSLDKPYSLHKETSSPHKSPNHKSRTSTSPIQRSVSPRSKHRGNFKYIPRDAVSPRRRSITPRLKSVSPRRSFSPMQKSISPRQRSTSPRRRSISPRRRSISPRHRSISPRRRSISPRRRSVSPRRRSISPRRRSISPRRRSYSPLSPKRRSFSPRQRSVSPKQRLISPRRRSVSPRYHAVYKKRSISPRGRASHLRRRSISPHPARSQRRTTSPKKTFSPKRSSISPKRKSPHKPLSSRPSSPILKNRSLTPSKSAQFSLSPRRPVGDSDRDERRSQKSKDYKDSRHIDRRVETCWHKHDSDYKDKGSRAKGTLQYTNSGKDNQRRLNKLEDNVLNLKPQDKKSGESSLPPVNLEKLSAEDRVKIEARMKKFYSSEVKIDPAKKVSLKSIKERPKKRKQLKDNNDTDSRKPKIKGINSSQTTSTFELMISEVKEDKNSDGNKTRTLVDLEDESDDSDTGRTWRHAGQKPEKVIKHSSLKNLSDFKSRKLERRSFGSHSRIRTGESVSKRRNISHSLELSAFSKKANLSKHFVARDSLPNKINSSVVSAKSLVIKKPLRIEVKVTPKEKKNKPDFVQVYNVPAKRQHENEDDKEASIIPEKKIKKKKKDQKKTVVKKEIEVNPLLVTEKTVDTTEIAESHTQTSSRPSVLDRLGKKVPLKLHKEKKKKKKKKKVQSDDEDSSELDVKIEKIKAKNEAIARRQREIELDKEKYG
ncbi:hypothetical protein Btru_035508 [Bulinus truncatus]|nr:hypothetical protein Btru_035508 [Bulinus truncatus]